MTRLKQVLNTCNELQHQVWQAHNTYDRLRWRVALAVAERELNELMFKYNDLGVDTPAIFD